MKVWIYILSALCILLGVIMSALKNDWSYSVLGVLGLVLAIVSNFVNNSGDKKED